ncbi:MAG: histidine phosphatase family protein [Clostridia bacterium]|nr:histidine phosphatase family protein [Clostridia bacterium]
MKILIIRHGHPDYATDSLTEKGRIEAELLSRRLARMKIDDVYCSPMGRARETARPTLEKLGKEEVVLPWLHEFDARYISPRTGKEELAFDLMPQYWSIQPELYDREKWVDHGLYRTGGIKELYEQTKQGVDALLGKYGYIREPGSLVFRCEKNDDRVIALFCHCIIGQTIIAHLLGMPAPVLWHTTMMPTSSVTTLVTEERIPGQVLFRMFQMGDTSHLYAADEPVSTTGCFPECALPKND